MAERSMAVVLKTTVPARVPGVRIPLPPPASPGLVTLAAAPGKRHAPERFVGTVRDVVHDPLPGIGFRIVEKIIREADTAVCISPHEPQLVFARRSRPDRFGDRCSRSCPGR